MAATIFTILMAIWLKLTFSPLVIGSMAATGIRTSTHTLVYDPFSPLVIGSMAATQNGTGGIYDGSETFSPLVIGSMAAT